MTIVLGSTLATILLSATVSWSEGVAARALLAGPQFAADPAAAGWRFPVRRAG